jgi:hypothetical protein
MPRSIVRDPGNHPSRRKPAFIDLMTSEDHENRCDPHRRNGCAEHVIVATAEAFSKFKLPA